MSTKSGFVEDISTFRRQQVPLQVYIFPERREGRKSTDVAFIAVYAICVIGLLGVMIYALINSDIKRLTHGYDDCGNVCGSANAKVDGIGCSGVDMTNKPFLHDRQCVETCPFSKPKFNRCNSDYSGFFPNTVKTLDDESVNLTILCLIGAAISVFAVGFFRYFPKAFVWAMLIIFILMLFAITGLFWFLYSDYDDGDDDDANGFLGPAIIFTVLSLFFALCILVIRSRINIMISFFKAAGAIVFAMPLLLLEPIVVFLSNFVVMGLFVYTYILYSTSGTLQYQDGTYDYVPNGAVIFLFVWSVLMMLWTLQFILACQQMIVAGAVAAYYFTKDKLTLASPIYNSFYNLFRYHLGTAAFGSLILTTVTILKVLIRATARNNGWMRLVYYCFRPLENLVKYMTSMGYIETAIHGQPLCRSSLRAINLIVSNLLSAVAMNSIGNLVFFMAKFVVVLIIVGIGVLMQLPALIVVFGAVVSLMFVHCCFVVFEIALDTVFLCYCEDQCAHDGSKTPFYTSVDLHNEILKARRMGK